MPHTRLPSSAAGQAFRQTAALRGSGFRDHARPGLLSPCTRVSASPREPAAEGPSPRGPLAQLMGAFSSKRPPPASGLRPPEALALEQQQPHVAEPLSRDTGTGPYDGATTPHGNPMPPSGVHATLAAPALKPGRVVVVGDVHGCFLELQDLLVKIEFDAAVDNLVFVGDLVNKGPMSAQVVRFARVAGAFAVRGNHDDAALSALRMMEAGSLSQKQRDKYAWTESLSPADIAWLHDLPFTLDIPSHNVIVVHAGLVPGCPVSEQRPLDMYKMRDVLPSSIAEVPCECVPCTERRAIDAEIDAERRAIDVVAGYGDSDRGVLNEGATSTSGWALSMSDDDTDRVADEQTGDEDGPVCIDPPKYCDAPWRGSETVHSEIGRAWASEWRGPQCVIFGHDAARQIQLESHAIGLDSGCAYGKTLTAAVLPSVADGAGACALMSRDPDAKAALLAAVPARAVYQAPKKKKKKKDKKDKDKRKSQDGSSGSKSD